MNFTALKFSERNLPEADRRGTWRAVDVPEVLDPALDRCGRYPVSGTARTDRFRAIVPGSMTDSEAGLLSIPSRRQCADHTAVADKLGEPARLRALNREMRRQWRRDHPLCLGDRLLLIASAASCIALLLIAAGAL